MSSSQAKAIATRCWCDERTKHIEMDTSLAEVFAEKIDKYLHALKGCTFANNELWYLRIAEPLIQECKDE